MLSYLVFAFGLPSSCFSVGPSSFFFVGAGGRDLFFVLLRIVRFSGVVELRRRPYLFLGSGR